MNCEDSRKDIKIKVNTYANYVVGRLENKGSVYAVKQEIMACINNSM